MKSHDELKAETEAIQQQMVEAKKNKRAIALKEVKRLCKEFGFTAGMFIERFACRGEEEEVTRVCRELYSRSQAMGGLA